jgi:hypothetical protein
MPYVTSVERLANRMGRLEGQVEMLLLALERKFRVAVPEEVAAQIRAATEPATLQQWLAWVFETSSMEEFQRKMLS